MDTTGTRSINASPSQVWAALQDPGVLQRAIPACKSVTGDPEDGFTAEIAHQIGPMPLAITAQIDILDAVPERAMTLRIAGRNLLARGTDCGLVLRLEPADGQTILSYTLSLRLSTALKRAVGSKLDQGLDRLGRGVVDRLAGVIEEHARANG